MKSEIKYLCLYIYPEDGLRREKKIVKVSQMKFEVKMQVNNPTFCDQILFESLDLH